MPQTRMYYKISLIIDIDVITCIIVWTLDSLVLSSQRGSESEWQIMKIGEMSPPCVRLYEYSSVRVFTFHGQDQFQPIGSWLQLYN